eukprot:14969965-Alexandrium_andersonii.AAC.1
MLHAGHGQHGCAACVCAQLRCTLAMAARPCRLCLRAIGCSCAHTAVQCTSVRACVCACVRACVRARVRA